MNDLVETSETLPLVQRRTQDPYMGHQEMNLQIVEKLVNNHKSIIICTPTRQKSFASLRKRITCFTIMGTTYRDVHTAPRQ